jgi:DNA-binding LacI/PurR family transcriptional regulator
MPVASSNREVTRAMTLALIESGYRKIVLVMGRARTTSAHAIAPMVRAAVRDAGIASLPIEVVSNVAAIRAAIGAKALRKILKVRPEAAIDILHQ